MRMLDSTRRIIVCLVATAGLAACGSQAPAVTGSPALSASSGAGAPSKAGPLPSTVPGSPGSAGPAPSPTVRTAPPETDEPRDLATPRGRELPLTVMRVGGLAGTADQVTVEPDGTAVLTGRGRQPVRSAMPATDLAELRRLLTDPAFAAAASPTGATGVCADGYRYRLRTPKLSVVTDDCSKSRTPAVGRVLALVVPLMNR
jgi:hypothetical protein